MARKLRRTLSEVCPFSEDGAKLDLLEVASVNKSTIAGIFNGAVLVAILIALISPNTSWADDHLLSINGATVTQNAIVTHGGAVTQTLNFNFFPIRPIRLR